MAKDGRTTIPGLRGDKLTGSDPTNLVFTMLDEAINRVPTGRRKSSKSQSAISYFSLRFTRQSNLPSTIIAHLGDKLDRARRAPQVL